MFVYSLVCSLAFTTAFFFAYRRTGWAIGRAARLTMAWGLLYTVGLWVFWRLSNSCYMAFPPTLPNLRVFVSLAVAVGAPGLITAGILYASLGTGPALTTLVATVVAGGIMTTEHDPRFILAPLSWNLIVTVGMFRARGVRERWQCRRCRYDLSGLTSRVCPECGTAMEDDDGLATLGETPR